MAATHVAVAVVFDKQHNVLLTQRHPQSHLGGLWEFPGGKLQRGETVEQALVRELREEVGIEVSRSGPLLLVPYNYTEKAVLLDVHVVREFRNDATAREGQPLAWVAASDLDRYDLPAANLPIVIAVQRLLSV